MGHPRLAYLSTNEERPVVRYTDNFPSPPTSPRGRRGRRSTWTRRGRGGNVGLGYEGHRLTRGPSTTTATTSNNSRMTRGPSQAPRKISGDRIS